MRIQDQSGISTLMIMLLLSTVIAIGYKVTGKTLVKLRAQKHLELRDEIRSLQRIFVSRMSCHRTLGTDAASTTLLSCAAFPNLVPKDENGTPFTQAGKIGNWTIKARCENNAVVIGATRQGKDPISGVDVATMAFADDIFEGTSPFCKEYFAPNSTCSTAPYTLYRGSGPDGATCCRRHSVIASKPGAKIAGAACHADEYLAGGYSSCAPSDTGMTAVAEAAYPPRYRETFGFGVAQAMNTKSRSVWLTDCFNAMGSNAADAWSQSTAICCPLPYRRQ